MKNIATAFIKAKRAFSPALKDKTNPHFRSKYADLGACLEAVNDALLENEIAVYQETSEDTIGVTVETVLLHASGESIRSGKLHVPASKNDAQGFGSALTYARRYSLMAACGIAPEDDDGNAASKPQKAATRAPVITPTSGVTVALERTSIILDTAEAIKERFAADDLVGAYELYLDIKTKDQTGGDEVTFLWKQLPSNIKSAIKRHGETLKETTA